MLPNQTNFLKERFHGGFVSSKVHVEFSDEKDSVSLEGPPQEVEKAKESLETFIHELVSWQHLFFASCSLIGNFLI